ncbi:MAG: replication initiation factor domain-containing protein [Oscillospiraceae bacterium]|nr:replication initiation factor domain-containing protein [Oscillospiraceae bacterium]
MNNRVIYDYLTFTTKIHDAFSIIDFLGFDVDMFQVLEGKGRYFYKNRLVYNNCVNIYYDGQSDDMGVCVEMSGEGCRTFETSGNGDYQKIFDMINENWDENSEKRQANITRLDIAYDDFLGILDLDYFVSSAQKKDFVSRSENWNASIGNKGCTVEHGNNRQSNVYIRIYDKLTEQIVVRKREIDPAITHWVRCEIQLRNECARGFIKPSDDDIREKYFKVLNNYLRYVIHSDDSNKRRLSCSPEWLRFIENWETISIFDKPGTIYNLSRLDSFVFNQVGGAVSTMMDVMGVDKFIFELHQRQKEKPLNPKYREIKRQSDNGDQILEYLREHNLL